MYPRVGELSLGASVSLTVATVVLVWFGVLPLGVVSAGPLCAGSRRRRELRGMARSTQEINRTLPLLRRARFSPQCFSRAYCDETSRIRVR